MGRRSIGNTPSSKAKHGGNRNAVVETPRTPERLDTSEVESIIKTPPFTSRGGRTSPVWDEYHSLEYFDINPKTDYTYAHSLSYNPAYIEEPDIIPNMSRNRINSHASGYSLQTSGIETPPPYRRDGERARRRHQEELEYEEERRRQEELQYQESRRRYLESLHHDQRTHSEDRSSYSRVTYTRDGMVLRSGSRLSGVGSYLERNDNQQSASSTSLTSSQSLVRSLNSDFEAVDSSRKLQHSTPLSHLYAKNSEDTSLGTDNLSVSGIFSPRRSVRTVVTTETTEYIDLEGRRRVRQVDSEKEREEETEAANSSGWFSGIRNIIGASQADTTLTEQKDEVETQTEEQEEDGGQTGRGGLFGMFRRTETTTEEEEEARRAALISEAADTDAEQQADNKGWFGLFRRTETTTEEEEARRAALASQAPDNEGAQQAKSGGWFGIFRSSETTRTTEEEEEEARRQAMAADSDSEYEEETEHPGWRNRFKNLLTKTTEEKWQTESVKERDKNHIGDPGDRGWFRWLRTRDAECSDEPLEPRTGWFGWSRSSQTETDDKNRISENHKGDSSAPKAGWFGWTSTSEVTSTLQDADGVDQVDGDSKSRLFSWLGKSNEEKVAEDMKETEGDATAKSGWFSWLKHSSTGESPETVSPSKTRRRSGGRKVTFSLDSEEDGEGDVKSGASSSSSVTMTSRSSRSSRSSQSTYGKSQTWMQLILTAITTVSSFMSDLFRPITDSYAYRQTKLVIWRRLRIADMWLVSRSFGGCCCLCLPLLLLLPLLLGYLYGGELLEQARASVKSFTLISVNETQKRPLPYVDPSTINIKIQQFFDEHKHRYELSQLSEEDVKKIAQAMISSQLGDLKLALLQDINQVKGDQIASKTNHQNSMDSLEKKLGDFISKYQSLENDMAALRASGKLQVDGLRQDNKDKINILEHQIKSLGDEISNLQISHLELLASVRNCCRNDSFYAIAVRKHVQDIFAQMMAGGGAGGSGSDEGYGVFLHWLQANYARKEDMDKELAKVSEDITQRILTITKEQASSVYIQSNTQQGPGVSDDYIRWIVDDALQKFSADQVGMADYALESAGGSVLSVRCSETYYKKTALVSVFGIPLWYTTNSARTVIQPDVHPGQCWAFKGARGFLVVQLAVPVKPSGFTLEHIPKALSPTGKIDSAPREFAVYGLSSESDKVGVSLGNYTYSESGKPIQYFPIQATTGEFFEFVELKVLGNHGNPEYTCLYRFRVHGMPYKPS